MSGGTGGRMVGEQTAAGERPDLIVRGARLIDGTGADSRVADLAVRDDRIVAIGDLSALTGGREIDARGLSLSPGFIDVHTHDDRAVLATPEMTAKVSQGVTTVVVGNCGISLSPLETGHRPPPPLDLLSKSGAGFFASFEAYAERLDAEPAALNVAAQVGHSTLRAATMDDLSRPATAGEVAAMCRLLSAALDAGAIGMSTGLFYPTAIAAPTDEVIELARVLNPQGGIHTTHMRNEADAVAQSLEETFRIGRDAGVRVVISHHKCAGAANHGRSAETLRQIAAAMEAQDVGLDVYPYNASSTILKADMARSSSRVIVAWSSPHPEASGRDLDDIARDWGVEAEEAIGRLSPAGGIYFMMDEADVQRIMTFPHSMIGSDGLPHDVHPHPRLWGTFPRVLGHYARDLGLFRLEEAIRKMTGLSAERFNLEGRGVLKVGNYADLVLLDASRVIDRATFSEPTTPAEGIEAVFVNGREVWAGGATGQRPGRLLRAAGAGTPAA